MPKTHLRETLQQLQSDLAQKPRLDQHDQELLIQLRDNIETLLELSTEASPQQQADVRTGLGAAVDRFEESHPSLTAAMGRLINALSSLGI
jgi:ElaB/YqjD/DUF883 family membrane-anchored ribosome-binding protein